jgi:hypothetical protein
MSSESLDIWTNLTDLEARLESIIQRRSAMLANTNTIALIASKPHFDPITEQKFIEKSKTTSCKCRHYSGTRPCLDTACSALS